MKEEYKQISKFLSLVLRHQPELIGIELTTDGWVNIPFLLAQMSKHGKVIDRDTLEKVVQSNDKQRFSIDQEHNRIRANQGHSVEVDLGLAAQTPPPVLYHGTATKFLDSILAEGLQKQQRHHVHLSANLDTARKVGQRHGKPIILTVDTVAMTANGFSFYLSDNLVWLVDSVPPNFLKVLAE
jgi:putative RNA 2'-phosphotransferase